MTPTQLLTYFFSITRDGTVAVGTRNLGIISYLVFGNLLGSFHDAPDYIAILLNSTSKSLGDFSYSLCRIAFS